MCPVHYPFLTTAEILNPDLNMNYLSSLQLDILFTLPPTGQIQQATFIIDVQDTFWIVSASLLFIGVDDRMAVALSITPLPSFLF